MTTKLEKKIVALIIVATMVLSSVSAFANPAPSHVAGTGTVTNPVFAVLLPTAIAINVNPLQIGSNLNPGVGLDPIIVPQVSSAWQVIVNRSNVPVNVEVRVARVTTTVATTQAHFVNSENDVTNDSIGGAAASGLHGRRAYLAIRFANNPAVGATALQNTATAVNWSNLPWGQQECTTDDFTLDTDATGGAGAAMSGGNVFNVILDNHQYNTGATGVQTIAPGTVGAGQFAAFRFHGAVNPHATWSANSVSSRVVFTITGISPIHAEAVRAASTPRGAAHNIYKTVDVTATNPNV